MATLTNPDSVHESPKKKVIFILGATGTGKSKLSIDIATHIPAEIINSDKIQVYKGLDIVTNKVSQEEQLAVPHHLLGHVIDPQANYTPKDFAQEVFYVMDNILESGRIPIIAGGSNSYVEALVDDPAYGFNDRFESCFIWLDVDGPVLRRYVEKRVDDMVRAGLVEEVKELFDPNADYTKGIRRAIGVPEFDRYFREEHNMDEEEKSRVLNEAIREVKDNTWKLCVKQVGKIQRLRDELGWKLRKIDATSVFEKSGSEALREWDEVVVPPSMEIVTEFLNAPADELKISVDAAESGAKAESPEAEAVPVQAGAGASDTKSVFHVLEQLDGLKLAIN
ncbi:hypothetical protein Ancab_018137 [Ancistrocladus abbreviatus]